MPPLWELPGQASILQLSMCIFTTVILCLTPLLKICVVKLLTAFLKSATLSTCYLVSSHCKKLHYTLRFCGSKLSFYSLLFYFSVPCEYEFLRGVVILHTSKAQANNLCADSFSAIGNNTYHFYNTIKMPAIRTVSFNKGYRWQDQRTNIQIGVT